MKFEYPDLHPIIIHFGVYSGSGCFSLEQCGYNCKSNIILRCTIFNSRYERQSTSKSKNRRKLWIETLSEFKTWHSKTTVLSFLQIHCLCITKSRKLHLQLCLVSTFISLSFNSLYNFSLFTPCEVSCLFVHIPTFAEIDQSIQESFVIDLLKEISNIK